MQVDRELLPLTHEALTAESDLLEMLAYATRKGFDLREWTNGFRLDAEGRVLNFGDLQAAKHFLSKEKP